MSKARRYVWIVDWDDDWCFGLLIGVCFVGVHLGKLIIGVEW